MSVRTQVSLNELQLIELLNAVQFVHVENASPEIQRAHDSLIPVLSEALDQIDALKGIQRAATLPIA